MHVKSELKLTLLLSYKNNNLRNIFQRIPVRKEKPVPFHLKVLGGKFSIRINDDIKKAPWSTLLKFDSAICF